MKTKNTSKFLIDLQWFADPVVLKEPKDLEKFANETAEKLESVDEIKATVTAQAEELEAEKAKTAPEAIQALVTEEITKAGHAPIDNIEGNVSTSAEPKPSELTGLAKAIAAQKANLAKK